MPNIADDEACQIDSKGNNTATINCEKQYQNRHKIILEKNIGNTVLENKMK